MSTTEIPFAETVRAELSRQNLSIRGLARRMNPGDTEKARRSLYRWLNDGIEPSAKSRAAVAEALGVEL
jgi:transcriptional regulator with XRE-family HTH domain